MAHRRGRVPASTPLVNIEDVPDEDSQDDGLSSAADLDSSSGRRGLQLILEQPEYLCAIQGKPPLATMTLKPQVDRVQTSPDTMETETSPSDTEATKPSRPHSSDRPRTNASERHVRFDTVSDTPRLTRRPTTRTKSAPPGYSDSDSVISDISINKNKMLSFYYSDLGMGTVFLQMPDIMRDNMSKTLHMSYSSSVLAANPKTLTDDIIRLSLNKGGARYTLVNKIERRLETLQQRRKAYNEYMSKKETYKKAFAEKIDPFNQLRKPVMTKEEKERFGQKESEKVLTVTERSVERRDRVHIRTTKLLPSQRIKLAKHQAKFKRPVTAV